MATFLQQHAYKARVKALSEAIKAIDEIEPVFDECGNDVTASIRQEHLIALQEEYEILVEGGQSQSTQKAPPGGLVGTIVFYLQAGKAKEKYKTKVKEIQNASERARHEQTLKGAKEKAAGGISSKVIDKLLRNPRLSYDTKRVINDMRKTSLEAGGTKSHVARFQHVAHGIQQHIWDPKEIAQFEQTQNQLYSTGSEPLAQQTPNVVPQQGLSIPPWMAQAGANQPEQVVVQDPVSPTGGKHRRMGTFGDIAPSMASTSSAVSVGGSSGYNASSSSGGSIGLSEDDLADINSGEVFNNLTMVLSQDRSLESLDL